MVPSGRPPPRILAPPPPSRCDRDQQGGGVALRPRSHWRDGGGADRVAPGSRARGGPDWTGGLHVRSRRDCLASDIAVRRGSEEPPGQGGDDRRAGRSLQPCHRAPWPALSPLGRRRRRHAAHRQCPGRPHPSRTPRQRRHRRAAIVRGAGGLARLCQGGHREQHPSVDADQPCRAADAGLRQRIAAGAIGQGAGDARRPVRPAARHDRRTDRRCHCALRPCRADRPRDRLYRCADLFRARLSVVRIPLARRQHAPG